MDRRNLKRRHLIYYLRVFNQHTGELIGHLVDVTAEGIMLISEKPIPEKQDFEFKMLLPDEILGTSELTFNAYSLWCRPDINPDFYDSGFRIADIETKGKEVVELLIESYGFRD